MGTTHNTHVKNKTDETVKIVLTDNDHRNTSHVIGPKGLTCIPTQHGKVTVSLFRSKDGGSSFTTVGTAQHTDYSDRSFIINYDNKGGMQFDRAKYGTVNQEETGLRK